MTRDDVLWTLRVTLNEVRAVARDLTPTQLAQPFRIGEWSMTEILHHLILGERDVILPRFRRILAEKGPVFPSSAADRTGFAANPVAGDFHVHLATFQAIRQATLAFLETLRDRDWQRLGTTPTRGTLTIEAYARYLANHDLEHLAQMQAIQAAIGS